MNFKKSFAMSPEMRNILPVQRNRKPTKNFLVENIKNLREMQLQMEATKKAMEAKKVQKPKERSPFSVAKGINNPLWIKYSPTSDEIASGRSGGSGSSQSAHILDEKKSKASLPIQLVDQAVQTSPPNVIVENEDEELSHHSSQPSNNSLGSVQPSTTSKGPSVDSAHPSTPPQVQEISEPALYADNEAATMKEKAINKIWKETGVNFVELNRRMEYKKKVAKEKPHAIGIPPNYQLGELPRYLKDKKKANSEQTKNTEELSLNQQSAERPGYILLSDEERLEHLKLMKKCYEELLFQFNQLPIRCDSYRAKQKRADLEKQLDNLENSMKLFSRDKLYIKL